MLNRHRKELFKAAFFLHVAVLFLANTIAFGQSTAFTYQGKLSGTGSRAASLYGSTT